MSAANRKQIIDKEKKTIFAKDIVLQNPIFTKEEIDEFFNLFNLYADRYRLVDMADILSGAKSLGFEKKYKIIYDVFVNIYEEMNGEGITFEKFITMLTHKLGDSKTEEGRKVMFDLVDIQGKGKLNYTDMKKVFDKLDMGMNDKEITQVMNQITGPNQRDITWVQFNTFVQKKLNDKKKNYK